MDPTTALIIAGAVGGAAGKLIEQAWGTGKKWLETYFRDHHPTAQKSAQQNALDFLASLANRVHDLEEALADTPDAKRQIECALSDPDFAAMLKDALIASARTESSEKHKLLARVVSERLTAQPESMVSLAGNLACSAIPHLSSKHLRCLGVMAVVFHIRPTPFPPPTIPIELLPSWWTEWLSTVLSPVVPTANPSKIDYEHLVSVSCASLIYLGTRDLKKVLFPPELASFKWDANQFLTETEVGKRLSELWKGGMNRTYPTSAGQLIGTYVVDLLVGMNTTIDWD